MNKNIAVIRGDGIGPEIVEQALLVLNKVAELYGHTFTYTDVDMGGCAIDKWGDPLPEDMLNKCVNSDSVLLGAVGGDKWNNVPGDKRPEKGLLRLRAGMGVYSNNRPAKIWSQLSNASPLKKSIVDKGIDFIIVRELIGGIYFGEHKTEEVNGQSVATDILTYSEEEIERIGIIGFETARKRGKKLCSVEKSNVLDSSRLWKKVMHRLAERYPDVTLTDMLVDNCAMQIVKDPSQFDVVVTENMFGDILSDEASMITGSIGMIPSSSLGATSCGLYEPIHGSAPDIAGKDIANPIGTILSAAMMLRYSFDMPEEADCIEKAVESVLDEGYRTADIMPSDEEAAHCTLMGCKKCGELVVNNLKKR
ncbi:MAG: 3-isopropylmalate dehydrogenase [Clostridia bacterium]|nr:3-isopropylmalate dehydrogenase [Clostridia bacterium]